MILGVICYQDYKERAVYAFLFPVLGMSVGLLHSRFISSFFLLQSISFNMLLIALILGVLFLYSKFKIKKAFFKEVFGLGDAFMFIAMTFAFPTYTFLVLFSAGLIVVSVLNAILLSKEKHTTIPLAGQLAAYYGIVFIISWSTPSINLYLI